MAGSAQVWFAVAIAGAGCGTRVAEEPPVLPGTTAPSCELHTESYRISAMEIPVTSDVPYLNFDLDGDGHYTNALASIMQTYRGQLEGFPVAGIELALETGRVTWVIDLATCADGSTDEARIRMRSGAFAPTLAAVGAERPDRITAELGDGILPVTALFQWEGVDDVRWVQTYATTYDLARGDNGTLTGTIGLAFQRDPAFDLTLPVVMDSYNRAIQETGCASLATCPKGSVAARLLGLYDEDGDGVITLAELENDLIISITGPDSDLLDLSGVDPVFWPLHDEAQESMTFGFRVTATIEP